MFNSLIKNIYIHIPFCAKKCIYCDFPIQAIGNSPSNRLAYQSYEDNYTLNLIKEIEHTLIKSNLPKNHHLKTLYFGGGTPSLLSPKNFDLILNSIFKHFNSFDQNYEFTIENDPDSLNRDLLTFYKTIGVNRISLGVQTFNQSSLKMLNRNHTIEQTIKSIDEVLRLYTPESLCMDMILGIPNEEIPDLENTLKKLISYSPGHISAYILTVEENTKLKTLVDEKVFIFSDDDLAKKYLYVQEFLKKKGFEQYELSNFCKQNVGESLKSKHNSMYWLGTNNFYGFGMGATSLINQKRFSRPTNLKKYYEFVENICSERLILDEMGEKEDKNICELLKTVFIGNLRTFSGLKIFHLKMCFGHFLMEEEFYLFLRVFEVWNKKYNLVVVSETNISVLPEKFIVLNGILVEIFRLIESFVKESCFKV